MNTLDLFRELCVTRTSVADATALLISCGHSEDDVLDAFAAMLGEGATLTWTKAEYPVNANVFLVPA